ncbi:hypothetical protein QUF88_14335 [Bacillus sp. DX1.1]|uniref:DUF6688 domain-containing protein n=1 Tax=unclassified Bacillus (in: firmicutes) TaxID=185979 RepID=UPI0025704785|nr:MULTISPECIES: DUF6688 family protein [unclassified Bacillus (in: firmicutes)]MDM5154953.1 hypothetical protein [Bacillus sp. DX1.1]WJE84080.1 hypothetical protein QRE67_11830 [Bacillus sp. DX3.1]
MIIFMFLALLLFIIPIERIWKSFLQEGEITSSVFQVKKLEFISICISYFILWLGIMGNLSDVQAGQPLHKYEYNDLMQDQYASLASDHIFIVVLLFILGGFSYWKLSSDIEKLSPVMYIVYSSLLILNVIFTVVYITHTGIAVFAELLRFRYISVLFIQASTLSISLLFISKLKDSLNYFIQCQKNRDYKQENMFMMFLYRISFGYQKMSRIWMVSLFPILLIIQFILVLFGQRPDSFIRVFFETSSFNYSKIAAPSPEILHGDGHYLCTVSVKGHKKIVKPLRAGIRHGERITVNRQLLVANAFENIIEERAPKCHKVIRDFYDKYGYPISQHINTKWSADFIYIIMKPLEWFFLLVLYTVDKNPENRIHIQYSELRK